MSRIGRKPINVPSGISVSLTETEIKLANDKGTLSVNLISPIKVKHEGEQLIFTNDSNTPQHKALHGLIRSLVNNTIIGLTSGYHKELQLVGTGYRVAPHSDGLSLSLGFSHPVIFHRVPGVDIVVEGTDKIKLSGIDKQLVGQVAANIRSLRPPEPYKGKGIRYSDEIVIRKAGKAAVKSST